MWYNPAIPQRPATAKRRRGNVPPLGVYKLSAQMLYNALLRFGRLRQPHTPLPSRRVGQPIRAGGGVLSVLGNEAAAPGFKMRVPPPKSFIAEALREST